MSAGDPATRRPGDPATRDLATPATRHPAIRQSGNPAIRQPGGIFVLKMEGVLEIDEKNGGSMVWRMRVSGNCRMRTGRKIIELLLEQDFCVRALSSSCTIGGSGVSAYKGAEAGRSDRRGKTVIMCIGTVSRAILQELGRELLALAETAQGSLVEKLQTKRKRMSGGVRGPRARLQGAHAAHKHRIIR